MMQRGRRAFNFARIGALVPSVAMVLVMSMSGAVRAQDQGLFDIEWEPDVVGGRDPALQGFIHNRSHLRVSNVRLRVDALDAGARVIGQSFGWVFGDIPAGGRGYFVVLIGPPGTAYRVSVDSYDPIAEERETVRADSGAPAASPPLSR